MKKALLISLPSLLVVGVLSVVGVSQAVTTVPVPPAQQTVYTAPKPLEQKVVEEQVPVATPSPKPAQKALEAPVEATPTNEDLVVQYGWTKSPYRDSIDAIIERYPQFFTEELRVDSFEYVKQASPPVSEGGITWFYVTVRHKGGDVTVWVNLGKARGVDTSLYE